MHSKSLVETLQGLFSDADYADAKLWVIALGCLAATLVVAKLLLLAVDARRPPLNRYFYLNAFFILAVNIVLLGLFVYLLYDWVTYSDRGGVARSAAFFSVLLLELIGTVAFFRLLAAQRSTEISNRLFFQPISRAEEQAYIQQSARGIQRIKSYFLIPLLAIFCLFLLSGRDFNLISITLDTSSSMTGSLFSSGSKPPLKIGQQLLQRTISEFDERTDLIIGTFEEGDYQDDVAGIVSKTDPAQLQGIVQYFPGTAKDEALRYVYEIGNNEDMISASTPLAETVWKNFLITRQQAEEKNYASVIGIIITDGAGNLGSRLDGFLCDNQAFAEFYANPTAVNVIDLSARGGAPFIEKAYGCGYNIEDGSSEDLYAISLDNILKDYKRDWSLVYLLALFYAVYLLVNLFVQPKRAAP